MDKKLFVVSTVLEFPVVAKDEAEAKRIAAQEAIRDLNDNGLYDADFSAKPAKKFRAPNTNHSIKVPIGGFDMCDQTLDGSMTLGEAYDKLVLD